MGATYNGALLWQENRNESDLRSDVFGKNSEVFAVGDIVGIASGVLLVNTSNIVGVVAKTVTMASTNQTVAKVAPSYIPVDTNTLFLMSTNSDLTGNATDPGAYYSVTGATGAQKIDVTKGAITSGPQRCVEIVKVDPYNEGGTGSGSGVRKAIVRFLKTAYTNIGITS